MPSLRSTPCKSKLEDDRWQDFDAFRSQSQSATTTSKIVKGKAATGKTKGAKVVKGAKGADEEGAKALEGVEEKVKGEVKDEAKEDVGNEVSDEDMSEMSEASEGRVVEEDEMDEMDTASEDLSEREEEEEEAGDGAEEEAEESVDEGNEEEGSAADGDGDGDGDGDNGEEDHNPDGGDSARGLLSPRPTTTSPNRDRKPSPPDIKPSSSRLQPPHVPGPFNKLADDLVMEIAHHLLAEEAYASAVSLLGMSKRTKVVLRPLLRKTKKRVVLDLDDLRWVSRKTRKHIKIITCNSISALPFPLPYDPTEDELKEHRREIRSDLADLKPWALVYIGEPAESVLSLQQQYFPSVKVIRINTDLGIYEVGYLNPDADLARTANVIDQVNNVIDALRTASAADPRQPQIRVRYHERYRSSLQRDRPGQIYAKWKASYWGTSVMVEKESYEVIAESELGPMEKDFEKWLDNYTDHVLPFVDSIGFESISLDLYYQPHPSATGLYYSVDDEFPAVYDTLSEYADEAAEKWLEATTPKPLAELKVRFFVMHGEFQPRDEMKPVFRTHKAKKFDGSVKTRELFIDDDDFARCVKNGGCSRCKGTAV